MDLAKKYNPKESEKKWSDYWEKEKLFQFKPGKKIYSIDTPPPTISGTIHIGHAFSYAQAEFIARYKRMKGFSVFYPFGFDDNGLPTEKFVEKKRGIKATKMDRNEFIKICLEETKKVEEEYKKIWKSLGISCDWNLFYSTISEKARKISQLSFIELFEQGREYRKEAPTIWCPECATAISQVELEDKEVDSTFNDVLFELEDGKKIVISTTRPELIPACVAVMVNPEDEKNNSLVGKKVKVPLMDYSVQVIGDKRVDPSKGSGIVMNCTFGDQMDMEWWKAYNLPLRIILDEKGVLNEKAGKFSGMKLPEARKAILEELKAKNLLKEQRPIKHTVNVHERCSTPIEFLVTKQWFIKYLDLKEDFLNAGKELNWFPEYMKHRFNNWIKGLQWDWCISRQRFYGIPFPVWYCTKCGEIILAEKKDLPVDPLKDKPKKQCKCGSSDFIPEKDVLDTWATSSLTPLINSDWKGKGNFDKKIFPMSLRPQAHDIISFWALNTVVKSLLHEKKVPWKDIMISGWGLDSKGKKMSKSKGNVVTPNQIIEKYSADALRYWASSINLGNDAPFQEKDVQTGQKLITKLWNASKFSLINLEGFKGKKPVKLELMDEWILHKFNAVVKSMNSHFDVYEYSKAKSELEYFFWNDFTDNYLEIIKDRIYNEEKRGKNAKLSAQYTLEKILLGTLKGFAPIMPFITEEIFHLYFSEKEKQKSIHVSSFPEPDKKLVFEKSFISGEETVTVISSVRKFKASKQVSMKAGIELTLEKERIKKIGSALEDLKAVCNATLIKEGK
ncbi:valine--tRNA ligase, partial [Candidatus Micrarchaeota archaeon]|nr:valine--tRNA ligase [Candidatus Micrarchaeota archaeon]